MLAHAQVSGSLEQPTVFQQRTGNSFEIFVKNPLFAPITLRFDISANNMGLSQGNSFEMMVPARSTDWAFKAAPANPQAPWSFNYNYKWVLGDTLAQHDDRVVYDLPFAQGKRHGIMQGFGGWVSHSAEFQYAIDFDMPLGTLLTAAREGVVVLVETSYTEGRFDPALRDKANVVTVLHADGTFSEYVHLQPRGSLVRVGQEVKRGDPIGYSGNTGYTSAPHLHFHVYKRLDTNDQWTTLPIRFRAVEGNGIELKEGRSYTRP
jgi:murein DD-endopeptidase MepM/ murein hydrolase activator NlpD